MVCVHQTPPFQAIRGRLPGAIVIAPQAPPLPNEDDWNWAEHVMGLAAFSVWTDLLDAVLSRPASAEVGLACCNSYQLFQARSRAGPLSIRNPRGMTRRRPPY